MALVSVELITTVSISSRVSSSTCRWVFSGKMIIDVFRPFEMFVEIERMVFLFYHILLSLNLTENQVRCQCRFFSYLMILKSDERLIEERFGREAFLSVYYIT